MRPSGPTLTQGSLANGAPAPAQALTGSAVRRHDAPPSVLAAATIPRAPPPW